jgi:chromosome segregation ATPase
MPEEKGTDMGTADLHGSTIDIETGKGEKTKFELVRLGTLKELKTLADALSEQQRVSSNQESEIDRGRAKIGQLNDKLAAAEAAYKAEKEARKGADSLIEAMKRESEELEAQKAELAGALDDEKLAIEAFRTTTSELRAQLDNAKKDNAEVRGHLACAKSAVANEMERSQELHHDLEMARGEVDDLMSVKASLEETNTALEVKEKELCESRDTVKAIKKQAFGYLNPARDALATERTAIDTMIKSLSDLLNGVAGE